MPTASLAYRDREFWSNENLRWASVYFRLEKCARIVNQLAKGRPCDLLDVGCGPLALLSTLIDDNIRYFGIDIAPHETSSAVMQADIVKNKIGFDGQRFDIVVAAGVFEYMGAMQTEKFKEIAAILRPAGQFVTTYTNFRHLNDRLIDHSLYNNIRPIAQFKKDLEKHFGVERWFPSSHNWYCSEPRRRFMRVCQMPLTFRIPVMSALLAVNYFFLCSLPETRPRNWQA
jgi:SAM-dependent methyltransferase